MSDSTNEPQEPTEEQASPEEPKAETVAPETVTQDEGVGLSTEDITAMFGDSFGDMEDFGIENEFDLSRQGGFRISVGSHTDFMTEINGKQVQGRMYLDDAILTALSHGTQSYGASTTDSDATYKLIQGQMRIKSRLALIVQEDGEEKEVSLNKVFWQIWQQFSSPEKRAAWNFEKFMGFMRNAGFPVDGNYIFNFELLGANPEAIERYFRIFGETGAQRVNRPNKPMYIDETLEFRQRGTGLQVTHLEIGKGDPTRGRNYGRKWTDEEDNVHTYPGAAFVDPIKAQIDNFQRLMSHYKTSVMFKRQAEQAEGDAKEFLEKRSSIHRGMAVQLLSNFGGVHRGMRPRQDSDEWGDIEDTYYTNRVRSGRFGVEIPASEEGAQPTIEEFNFWQPNPNQARAITANAGAGAAKEGGVLDLDESEEPF